MNPGGITKQIKKQKYKALRYFRQSNTTENLNKYKELRTKFKDTCKQKKSDYQRQNREELIESRKNSNLFWKTFKKFRYKAPQINHIQPGQWVDHFTKLLYTDNLGNLTENIQVHTIDGNYNEVFNSPFTISEIRNLKQGKSGGPDGILPEMVFNTMNDISEILLFQFNEIFNTGRYPKNWASSILVPIHKSGSTNDPNDFRGISLIDILNKVLTGIMYDSLYSWAEENSKIDESQAGFRQGYSTIDNIFTLMSMGQKYLSKKGGSFYCLFVDFSKAIYFVFERFNR